jgi:hypothetical protein
MPSDEVTALAPGARWERPDLRVLGAFVLVAALLVAPALPRLVAPLSSVGASDAAATLDAEAREGVALAEERPRATTTYISTQLADLAASAADTRLDLLRADVEPDAEAARMTLVDLGAQLRDELETMSVSVDDPTVLARGADHLAAISAQLGPIAHG